MRKNSITYMQDCVKKNRKHFICGHESLRSVFNSVIHFHLNYIWHSKICLKNISKFAYRSTQKTGYIVNSVW